MRDASVHDSAVPIVFFNVTAITEIYTLTLAQWIPVSDRLCKAACISSPGSNLTKTSSPDRACSMAADGRASLQSDPSLLDCTRWVVLIGKVRIFDFFARCFSCGLGADAISVAVEAFSLAFRRRQTAFFYSGNQGVAFCLQTVHRLRLSTSCVRRR